MIALHLRRQRAELRLVEADLELLGVLMIALQHADLGDVGEAERPVRRGVVELRRVEQAAVDRGHDFAARERIHCGAHGSKQIDRDADGAVLQTLEVVDALHRLLEPAERLRVERRIGERHDVGADASQRSSRAAPCRRRTCARRAACWRPSHSPGPSPTAPARCSCRSDRRARHGRRRARPSTPRRAGRRQAPRRRPEAPRS